MSEQDIIRVLDAEVLKLRAKIERQTEALKVAYDFAVSVGAVSMAGLFQKAWEKD